MFNLSRIFQNMPPIVKNLLLVNVIFFVAQFTLEDFMRNLELVPIFLNISGHGNWPLIFLCMVICHIFSLTCLP